MQTDITLFCSDLDSRLHFANYLEGIWHRMVGEIREIAGYLEAEKWGPEAAFSFGKNMVPKS
jgi:hypothetical protein